jgi:hypothetical protein
MLIKGKFPLPSQTKRGLTNCVTRTFASPEQKTFKYSPHSSTTKIHFVNCLQNNTIKNSQSLFLLSDVPEIKDINNSILFNFVETRFGTLAFTSKHNLESLKSYLKIDFHIIKINSEQFITYSKNNKSIGMVIYNAYCDLHTKTSYFLYYEVSASSNQS